MSLSSATSEVPAQPSTVVVAISEGIIPPSSSATPEAPAQSSSALVAVNDGQVVSSPTSSQEPVSLALQASADGVSAFKKGFYFMLLC